MDPRPPNPQLGSLLFSNYLANAQFPPTAFTQYVSGQSQNQNVRKRKNQDQPKERNPNWSTLEDETLCKAWLRISEVHWSENAHPETSQLYHSSGH